MMSPDSKYDPDPLFKTLRELPVDIPFEQVVGWVYGLGALRGFRGSLRSRLGRLCRWFRGAARV